MRPLSLILFILFALFYRFLDFSDRLLAGHWRRTLYRGCGSFKFRALLDRYDIQKIYFMGSHFLAFALINLRNVRSGICITLSPTSLFF